MENVFSHTLIYQIRIRARFVHPGVGVVFSRKASFLTVISPLSTRFLTKKSLPAGTQLAWARAWRVRWRRRRRRRRSISGAPARRRCSSAARRTRRQVGGVPCRMTRRSSIGRAAPGERADPPDPFLQTPQRCSASSTEDSGRRRVRQTRTVRVPQRAHNSISRDTLFT